MKPSCQLTIILPIYNPPKGWEDEFLHSLSQLQKEFNGLQYHVTIVNDGSEHDIESFIIEKVLPDHKNFSLLEYPNNQGKGYAIRYGLEHSQSDFYIYTDFDFPFGCHAVRQTYDILCNERPNLVIGTRDISYFKALPAKRKVISYLLMMTNAIVTRFRVKDTQAGLKGLDNKAKEIFLTTKTNSFIFEMEFILKCLKIKHKHKFIHVTPNPNIQFTNFKMNTIKRELKNYFKIVFGNE